MKKLLFLCSFLILGLNSWAETSHETTTDHFTATSLSLNPGGTTTDYDYITFSLSGSMIYSSFGADLYLPAGYEWTKDSYGEMAYIATDGTMFNVARGGAISTHTLGCEIQSDGALRITIYPSGNGTTEFKATSGALFDVYVKATTYAKPGAADIQIKNCFFTSPEGIQYDTENLTISDKVSASSSATASLSLSGTTKWSTLILPFDATLPEGVKAYTCSSKDDANNLLYLNEAFAISAFTPYIIYSDADCTETLTGTVSNYPSAATVTSGYLTGALSKQSITTGYVLQNLSEGVKFYNCGGDTFTIPAGKCWVNFSGSGAKGYGFSISDVSGIQTVTTKSEATDEIYNLCGQRVTTTQSGNIYIINGKKILK